MAKIMTKSGWSWPEAGWITSSMMAEIPAIEYPNICHRAPQVSILVMTRNHEHYLEQCVESILGQDFSEPFEVLIGEDFSSDNTLAVSRRLQEKHPEMIRVITADENVGIRSNFLRLVTRARAPLIALLEGDDYWTAPIKLRVQCDLIRSHPEYAVVAAKTLNRLQWLRDLPFYQIHHLLRRYAVHTSTLLIRAEHLSCYPCFPDNVCWESMLLGFLMARGTCGFIPLEMSYYRRHHGGLWHNADRLKKLEMSRECIDALDAFFFFRFRPELISREMWIYRMDAVFPPRHVWRHWLQTWNIQLAQAPRLLKRAPLAYGMLLISTALQPLHLALQTVRRNLALGTRWRRLCTPDIS
ncbi:glycosyltransferase [Cyanobium sp. BA5m-21]|uniref:glycosyltransferase family 2 protein n=1 Tax=Cyanobium sp. BA5m-10 TaxID=2823705 RepID=UPI0020CBFE0A|nr:glycosyltransferase [Cyanobium sp. BA5m-10]MCP9907922.1 glycosyltransferase [Cyanobium sp. BA5m-21]